MDNAVIVYESMFGGTRRVAEAIADGLASTAGCTVVEVNHAPRVISRDTDLLVIGAPTHAFGLSTRDTRREAQEETPRPVISAELGVREWLAALVVLSTQTRTAAFDTRVKQRWVAGSAAQKVAHAMAHKGLRGAQPVSFRVEGKTWPPLEGERLARAREWGETLGRQGSDTSAEATSSG
jgi:hypothetical protein